MFTSVTCDWDPDFGVQCTGGTFDVVDSESYSYDAVGNPTDSGATVQTGNRLTAFGGFSLAWDDAGFLTSKTGNGLTQSFYWNSLGQLDSVTTNGVTARFTYDGLGRRIRKIVESDTTHYLYDGANLFVELDGAGNRVAEYAHRPGIDRPHSVRQGGDIYFYSQEHVGSVQGLFHPSQGLQNNYRYDPWGNLDDTATESVHNPFRFTGREWDNEGAGAAVGAKLGRRLGWRDCWLSRGILLWSCCWSI